MLAEMVPVILVLLLLIVAGVHIAVALGVTSAIGIYLMLGDIEIVRRFIANTAYSALHDYIYAVIPLFMLMGAFLAKCGAATDLYDLTNRVSRWLPGRFAVATILSNALFAFVTGVSIAAAAAFSRIAYPEMVRYGYRPRFALGCIAGSACLGMLIPPSVLMIVWGVMTEMSIGRLFLAGVLPGLLLVGFFIAYAVGVAIWRPGVVGELREDQAGAVSLTGEERSLTTLLVSTALVLTLIVGVLAGIWMGAFTPTEGAGVGAVGALALALLKGLKPRDVADVVLDVARTTGPLLLLLFCAQLYSRVLTMTGFTGAAQAFLLDTGLGPYGVLMLMIVVWVLLGCVIDSISIILLTVPIFAPIAAALGFDPFAFAIIGILAIESGLLTPPFGILVFTVKAALPEERIAVGEIFRGALPYWLSLLAVVACIVLFPGIAAYLPNL